MDEDKINNEEETQYTDEIIDPEGDKIVTSKNKWHIILYVAVFVLACAVITVAAYTLASAYPYKKLSKSLENTMEDIYGLNTGSIDGEGFKELVLAKPTNTEMNFTYAGEKSFSSELLWDYDPLNKKAAGSLKADNDGTKLNLLDCYADTEGLTLNSMFLGEDYIKIPLTNIISGYNSSALSEILGKTDSAQDFSIDLFKREIFEEPSAKELLKEYLSSDSLALENLKNNIEVYQNNENVPVFGQSNKTAASYTVSVEGIYVADVIEEFIEYVKARNNSKAVAEEITPIINFITGLGNTSEEVDEFLDTNRYSAATDLAKSLSTQTVNISAYIYKNKIVGANWDFTLNDMDSVKDCSLNISTTNEGFGKTAKLIFTCGDSETKLDYDISRNEMNFDYEKSETLFEANYKTTVNFKLDDKSNYSLTADISNNDNADDTVKLTSEGTLIAGADGLAISSESTQFKEGTSDPRHITFDLNVEPLAQEITASEASAKSLFDMTKEELADKLRYIYATMESLEADN